MGGYGLAQREKKVFYRQEKEARYEKKTSLVVLSGGDHWTDFTGQSPCLFAKSRRG